MFQRLFSRDRNENRAIAETLYESIVAAARQEHLYSHWKVPDTPLGRFEMLSLHMFLFQHRLRVGSAAARDIAQVLIDDFFQDVDHSLRELGIGDLGIPKRMKKLARMYYGRTESYSAALVTEDRDALAAALARNIRPDSDNWAEAALLADYAFAADRLLATQEDADICSGKIRYPSASPDAG